MSVVYAKYVVKRVYSEDILYFIDLLQQSSNMSPVIGHKARHCDT